MPYPLIHITDLYHPPQDPDDHIDLATVIALEEFDLKAVILDVTRRFLDGSFDVPRDPGFVPVSQLGYITGRTIPVAVGPPDPLSDEHDDARNRPPREQAGIELLLETLRSSPQPVFISVVGSTRALAAAYNRSPALVKEKTRAVILNAGATSHHKEWNVELDPAAYRAVWRSGLPIDWYPCASDKGGFDTLHPNSTCWQADQKSLFHNLPAQLAAWFNYAFSGSARGDGIRAVQEPVRGDAWEEILSATRTMWATASLILCSGRSLVRTSHGWRFSPPATEPHREIIPMRLLPIEAVVTEENEVVWKTSERVTGYQVFRREPGEQYGPAMAEALNALLRSIQTD